ncbi:PREDICTED: L10-interacting MYB domain-containing protein-like [Lupinus angustifolius]|uniref:L10-interacting MYB domain-containing protein-like n=1 Tax=Lupinus angustifolius TaxID=3871 RepID=UPI00092F00C4|nr:PREDICTED: L10-interacting MYB domain-containing protein-like [Lupinus angustifolius]
MSETKSEPKRETWTDDMDNTLVEAFLHQQNEGNRVNGTFTTAAYEAIVKELQEKFERAFGKEKVKGRWKLLKRRFSKCFDLFKNGLSGFAWDPTTKRWCAEEEVWQQLIEKNPNAEEWMKKPIANYDKMMILYGKDRAIGQHAETAKDIRNKRQLVGESESFDDANGVTLESVQGTNDGNEVTSPEVQGTHNQAKRSRKSKDDEELDGIKVALQDLASAIREGNIVYEKVTQ